MINTADLVIKLVRVLCLCYTSIKSYHFKIFDPLPFVFQYICFYCGEQSKPPSDKLGDETFITLCALVCV